MGNRQEFDVYDSRILREFCRLGDVDIVKYLLDEGSDPTARDSEALLIACSNGHIEVAKLLLAVRGDRMVNPRTRNYYSFLIIDEPFDKDLLISFTSHPNFESDYEKPSDDVLNKIQRNIHLCR